MIIFPVREKFVKDILNTPKVNQTLEKVYYSSPVQEFKSYLDKKCSNFYGLSLKDTFELMKKL